MVLGPVFKVCGLGFRVQDVRSRVMGLGFGVEAKDQHAGGFVGIAARNQRERQAFCLRLRNLGHRGQGSENGDLWSQNEPGLTTSILSHIMY